MNINLKKHNKNRAGAMLPLVAVVLVILFVAAALSVDIATMHLSRSELRTATDAAARAAVEALGREQSRDAAIAAAKLIASENTVLSKGLTLEDKNISFGSSVQNADGSFGFSEEATPINSVRIIGARDASSPDGSVGLLFAPLFGASDFEPVQSATATRIDRDIALVLDVSGSMANNGRFEALASALNVFIRTLNDSPQEERVSLTVYSTQPRKLQPMTSDMSQILSAFATQRPDGFTGIGRGMAVGLDSILNDPGSREFALRSMIVMTDGRQNRGVNPTAIARQCAREDVTVHTITFSAGANQDLMREVARLGNGDYLHAETNEELVEAFETIAKQLLVLLIE